MKKFIKNPYAGRIKENGCIIRVTHGSGAEKTIIRERFVTPEEIETSNERRDLNLKNEGDYIKLLDFKA
jgi:hypothetical protein